MHGIVFLPLRYKKYQKNQQSVLDYKRKGLLQLRLGLPKNDPQQAEESQINQGFAEYWYSTFHIELLFLRNQSFE